VGGFAFNLYLRGGGGGGGCFGGGGGGGGGVFIFWRGGGGGVMRLLFPLGLVWKTLPNTKNSVHPMPPPFFPLTHPDLCVLSPTNARNPPPPNSQSPRLLPHKKKKNTYTPHTQKKKKTKKNQKKKKKGGDFLGGGFWWGGGGGGRVCFLFFFLGGGWGGGVVFAFPDGRLFQSSMQRPLLTPLSPLLPRHHTSSEAGFFPFSTSSLQEWKITASLLLFSAEN